VLQAQKLVSQLNADRAQLLSGVDKTSDLAERIGDIASALRSGHDAFKQVGRAAQVFNDEGNEFDRILRLLPGAYLRLGRSSTDGALYSVVACAVRLRLTGPDGQPFYTPQFGPSDNTKRCSRNDIAPLQGSPGYPPTGPPIPESPWDGQARVKEDYERAQSGNGG
jgi:phospholipid/cholesterol/gamma-HCH transport system substrate-binding protein